MNLQQLKARGALVAAAPIKKDVSWTHTDPETGETVTDNFSIYVRRLSFAAVERMVLDRESPDYSASAHIIAARALFGDSADESLTYDEAKQLEPSLANQLVQAINEVGEATPPKN